MEVVFLLDNCERVRVSEIEGEKVNGRNGEKVKQIIWGIMHKEKTWIKVRDLNGDYHYIFVDKICDIVVRKGKNNTKE